MEVIVDSPALARIGTALADASRRRILVCLLDGPRYPSELADALDLTRANVSNHLACLRGCGIVRRTAEGRRARYELADVQLMAALHVLAELDLGDECSSHLS